MTININPGQIQAKVDGAWKKGLAMLSSEILRDCNEFCKLDKGMLRASSMTASRLNDGILVWNTPYARRQYWIIPTAYEPGTCWQWCEAAKGKYAQRWASQAKKLMEMNL